MAEMLERLTPAEYKRWAQYFYEEPWGPHRDNLHAAVIAKAMQECFVARGTQIDLDRFMIRRREQDAPNRVTAFVRTLFRMAKPAPAPEKKP